MANLPFFSDLHRRWPTWTPECWQPNAIAGQKKKDEMSVSPHGRRLDKGQRSKIIDTYGGVSFIIVGIKLPTAFKLFKVESAGVPCSDPLSDPLFRSLVPIPCSDPLFRSLAYIDGICASLVLPPATERFFCVITPLPRALVTRCRYLCPSAHPHRFQYRCVLANPR
jgi:hypothetical protein